MTQPAKVQEPSMEEILASIRRIIADDEAKPAAAEKPPSPAAAKPEKPAAAAPAKPVMNDIPPSAIPAAQAAAAKVAVPPTQAPAASRHAACRGAEAGCVQQPGRH
jgi:cell pole-organizing protein PopZ